jgi:alpha-methylacyl-CoA racemase
VNLIGDFGGGAMYLVVGILAALREAERTGRGQVVDAAIVDGTAHLSTMIYGLLGAGMWRDERGVNLLDTGSPFYDVFRTSDGRYMAAGAFEPQFYAEFLRLLGLDGEDLPFQHDPAGREVLRSRFAAVFATRTQQEWTDIFSDSDACVAPVLSMREAPDHPHLAARGTFQEHFSVVQPAPAPRFSATPGEVSGPPPAPGEHSRKVLADWGCGDEWLAAGAVHEA